MSSWLTCAEASLRRQEFQTRSNVSVDRTWIGGFNRFLGQQSRKLRRLKPRFRSHLEFLLRRTFVRIFGLFVVKWAGEKRNNSNARRH